MAQGRWDLPDSACEEDLTVKPLLRPRAETSHHGLRPMLCARNDLVQLTLRPEPAQLVRTSAVGRGNFWLPPARIAMREDAESGRGGSA